MILAEICNNKIYRLHLREEDPAHQVQLRSIYRRTNELTAFECV